MQTAVIVDRLLCGDIDKIDPTSLEPLNMRLTNNSNVLATTFSLQNIDEMWKVSPNQRGGGSCRNVRVDSWH